MVQVANREFNDAFFIKSEDLADLSKALPDKGPDDQLNQRLDEVINLTDALHLFLDSDVVDSSASLESDVNESARNIVRSWFNECEKEPVEAMHEFEAFDYDHSLYGAEWFAKYHLFNIGLTVQNFFFALDKVIGLKTILSDSRESVFDLDPKGDTLVHKVNRAILKLGALLEDAFTGLQPKFDRAIKRILAQDHMALFPTITEVMNSPNASKFYKLVGLSQETEERVPGMPARIEGLDSGLYPGGADLAV